MDQKHLSVSMGSEISILALIAEHKDLGLVPFELQVPAEGASLVTRNLRLPQSY